MLSLLTITESCFQGVLTKGFTAPNSSLQHKLFLKNNYTLFSFSFHLEAVGKQQDD